MLTGVRQESNMSMETQPTLSHDSEHNVAVPKQVTSPWSQHRFLFMIAASIGAAFILVVISTSMYYMTGTAQLDLSRPSYQSVREELKKNKPSDSQAAFSSSGDITEEMFKDFIKRYDTRSKDTTSIDAFSGEPMSDQALGITSTQ